MNVNYWKNCSLLCAGWLWRCFCLQRLAWINSNLHLENHDLLEVITHLVSDEIHVTVLALHTGEGTLLLMELRGNQNQTVRSLNCPWCTNSSEIFLCELFWEKQEEHLHKWLNITSSSSYTKIVTQSGHKTGLLWHSTVVCSSRRLFLTDCWHCGQGMVANSQFAKWFWKENNTVKTRNFISFSSIIAVQDQFHHSRKRKPKETGYKLVRTSKEFLDGDGGLQRCINKLSQFYVLYIITILLNVLLWNFNISLLFLCSWFNCVKIRAVCHTSDSHL